MTYNVNVRESLVKSVMVEASSIEEAKEIVKQMYENEDIVLSSEDFNGDVNIKVYDKDFNELENWDDNYT